LWFGYNCNVTSGYPAGCDAGPADEGLGNMMYFQGAWATLNALAGLNYNWNIEGYVGYGAPTDAPMITINYRSNDNSPRISVGTLQTSGVRSTNLPLTTKIDNAGTHFVRALNGYKVWRLLSENDDNEDLWSLLSSSTIIDTSFVDTEWQDLPPGDYKYAVKAIYSNNVISIPAFSNEVYKDMMGVLAGIITEADTDLPIAGAKITAGNYSGISNEDGTYIFEVHEGIYDVVYATPEHYSVIKANISITALQTTTLNISMTRHPQISGCVVGSDDPTVGISGASITLYNGSLHYETVTNPQGLFFIHGVRDNQTYWYEINANGYQYKSGQIQVGDSDLDLGSIVLNNYSNPISNVQASESSDYNTVSINWNVQGRGLGDGKGDGNPKDRAIVGYYVWRLPNGQQENEELWTLLTPNPINATTFTDSEWSALTDGSYRWAVKLVHSTGSSSNPVFSNLLQRRNPPQIIMPIDDITIDMNSSFTIESVYTYFQSDTYYLYYDIECDPAISITYLSGGRVRLTPDENWYGATLLSVKAYDDYGRYAEQIVRLTVWQPLNFDEDFNHSGDIPAGWNVAHLGSTSYPWQAYQVSGSNYAMKTMTTLGNTALERLVSKPYNLSSLKEIEVAFDTDFLPYGTGTGVFAYSFNNVTYTTVETLNSTFSGRKSYSILALTGKPNVFFRWIYTNNANNTGQNNHWIVDNFSITGVSLDTPPPAVSELEVQSVGPASVILAWAPINVTYFDSYELYVSDDEQVDTSDMLWGFADDPMLRNMNSGQTTITGLEDGQYWVAIRALDQYGNTSSLSDPVAFVIYNEPVVLDNPLPAGQPDPEWSMQSEVAIGCSIDGNFPDSGSIWYRVDYDQNGSYDLYENWQPYTGRSTGIMQNLPFLSDGVYHFEFKVEGMNGAIAYSGTSSQEGIADDWLFRIDTAPPTAIETFFVGATEDDAVLLFWTPSFDLNFAGYRIFYAAHPAPGEGDMIWNHLNDPNLINEGSGMVSTTITGLNPATRYYFALQALDAAGKIAQYPDYVTAMTTSSAAPKAPQNLVISIEGDQLVLDWDEVTEDIAGNAIQVAHYDIFLSEDPYFECSMDNYYDSYIAPPISLDYIVGYVDRLFVKVRAVTGAIRTQSVPARRFGR